MNRLYAAAARFRAAAAAAVHQLWPSLPRPASNQAAESLGVVLPFTPRPAPRRQGPWRPRVRPELRTIRERVLIYYIAADVPVAAALAVAGWPVKGAW